MPVSLLIEKGSEMVIVVMGSQRSQYPDYFDQLFRLRHKVFIEGRGWSLPAMHNKEIDQYDVAEAVYFLDINDDGRIEGSVRMTPSDRYSLLGDYFPHLVENGLSPRSKDIYEATRYIVLPVQKTRDGNRAAKTRLLIGVMEWCLSKKLSHLQTVIDSGTLSSFVEITPRTMPLGLSHPYGGGKATPGGGECMAFRWPITIEVLEDVRTYGGVTAQQNGWSGHVTTTPAFEPFFTV
jgi:acyl-homoserine lactone synthase